MRVADFNYELPAELIAQHPAPKRSASRLLRLNASSGAIEDLRFADLPALVGPGDVVVVNDTRVIRARLGGRKRSGGKIELFVERALGAREALALIRASHPPSPGTDTGFSTPVREIVLATHTADRTGVIEQHIEVGSLLNPQQQLVRIRALGATLVAISPELPDRTLTTAEVNQLGYPVLSDVDNAVARRYRLTHTIDPAVVGYQLGNGNDVAAFNGSARAEVPLPATYIIGTDGVVQFAFVRADYTHRAEPEDVLAVLRDLTATAHPAPAGARL